MKELELQTEEREVSGRYCWRENDLEILKIKELQKQIDR
jgi:hypothetical protein